MDSEISGLLEKSSYKALFPVPSQFFKNVNISPHTCMWDYHHSQCPNTIKTQETSMKNNGLANSYQIFKIKQL